MTSAGFHLSPGYSEIPPRPRRDRPTKIVVASAKAGQGASVVASSVAVYLSSIGRTVLAVDGDSEGPSLHTLLGLTRSPVPGPNGACATSLPQLKLYHAGLDGLDVRAITRSHRQLLSDVFAEPSLVADYGVFDFGATHGQDAHVACLSADQLVLVVTPEPTALEDFYRWIKRSFLAWIKICVADRETVRFLFAKARALGGAPAPYDLWRELEDDGEPRADVVRELMESYRPSFVVNLTRLRTDAEVGERIRTVVRRRFGVTLDYLGYVEYDDVVWTTMRSRRVLLVEQSGSKAGKSLERISRRILAKEAGKRLPFNLAVPRESHHDLLEVERGVTDDELRRAYKRVREIYQDDSHVCYSLFDAAGLDAVRTRVQEAFDVLIDPSRRRPYELSVFPLETDPQPAWSARDAAMELPPAPVIDTSTEFNGPFLKAYRESLGTSLEEVSATTKIGLPFLQAIEEDRLADLPAPVYVRGFVALYARFLGLDELRVSRAYVRRLRTSEVPRDAR